MKLMKIILLMGAILFVTTVGISQENSGRFLQFKLYKTAFFDLQQTQALRTITLGSFTAAISWGEDKNFNEIEITDFSLMTRAGKAVSYGAGLEYTYNYKIKDNPDNKFDFYCGVGVGGSFNTTIGSTTANSTQLFNTSAKVACVDVVVIPRAQYKLRNKIALELSLPYQPYYYQYSRFKSADPALLANQQITVFNEHTFFRNAISVKFGGIIKF